MNFDAVKEPWQLSVLAEGGLPTVGSSMTQLHSKHEKQCLAVAFGLLVAECARRGIGRTTAFKLARERQLETFSIGRRRYVLIASLDSLPFRLNREEQS